MTCSACGEHPKINTAKDFTKAVIEIDNPEVLILFRKVVIPTSMGDETEVPAAVGKYHNVLLVYEANNHAYLYSSDGIPTLLTSDVAQEIEKKINTVAENLATETLNRQSADNILQQNINNVSGDLSAEVTNRKNADLTLQGNINTEATTRGNADIALGNRLTAVEGVAATALQPADINQVVVTDMALNPTVSTSTVQLDESKINLMSGTTTSETVVLPVASTTQAGILNSSTFDAITANTNNLNAIMNGAVAITGLSASPSQSDLTTAWLAQTNLPALINRASIYDVTNDKVWTYYTNDATWHAASNTTQITVNTFTNSSEGTILGSTNEGQVFAESDGTGSVNGWDTLKGSVSTNTNNIGSLQTAVAGKQNTLTAGSNITITGSTIAATDTTYSAGTGLSLNGTTFAVDTTTIAEKSEIPTVNNASLTIQQNGTSVATFTANSSTNTTANITSPDITMTDTDPGEGSVLAANNFIGVYGEAPIIMDYSTSEVDTGAKWIDGTAIYKKTVHISSLPNSTSTDYPHSISNLSQIIKIEGFMLTSSGGAWPLPQVPNPTASSISTGIRVSVSSTDITIDAGSNRSSNSAYITLYYTKSS